MSYTENTRGGDKTKSRAHKTHRGFEQSETVSLHYFKYDLF